MGLKKKKSSENRWWKHDKQRSHMDITGIPEKEKWNNGRELIFNFMSKETKPTY